MGEVAEASAVRLSWEHSLDLAAFMAMIFSRRFWKWYVLVAIFSLVVCAFLIWRYIENMFPYGRSHCCSKVLGGVLCSYARDHNGFFPAGGRTPEASLSFLYTNGLQAEILRGKTVPLKVTQAALDKDGVLDPESTGWHYVEGLTEMDDPRIAIAWDKVGLGHNGQRMNGGHEVVLTDGSTMLVSRAAWPGFLAEQERLLAARSERARKGLPALVGIIKMPDGTLLDSWNGKYQLAKTYRSGEGSTSGNSFDLRWPRIYEEDGPMTFVLTLPSRQLRSKPVTVEVRNGEAAPDHVTFEMESY